MIDSRDINDLHPAVKRGALKLLDNLKQKGFIPLIYSTYRDNEKQNELYSHGRTKSGSKVTNAKGGQSMHNYKLAFDIVNKSTSGIANFNDNKFYEELKNQCSILGFTWGGNWLGFTDKPHVQFTAGATDGEIFNNKKIVPLDVKMTWELKTKSDFTIKKKDIEISRDGKNDIIEIKNFSFLEYSIDTSIINFINLEELTKLNLKISLNSGMVEVNKIYYSEIVFNNEIKKADIILDDLKIPYIKLRHLEDLGFVKKIDFNETNKKIKIILC